MLQARNLPARMPALPGLPAGSRRRGPALRGGIRLALATTISGFKAINLLLAAALFGGWPGFSPAAFAADADDPAAELASFQVADGFEVNLFASEKDGVVKPIQMRFDARGRLWVIGSTVYPQIEPGPGARTTRC